MRTSSSMSSLVFDIKAEVLDAKMRPSYMMDEVLDVEDLFWLEDFVHEGPDVEDLVDLVQVFEVFDVEELEDGVLEAEVSEDDAHC